MFARSGTLLVCFSLGVVITSVYAQEVITTSSDEIPQNISFDAEAFDIDVYRREISTVVANPRTIKSLFFRQREHVLLQDARSGLSVIVPDELQEDESLRAVEKEEEETEVEEVVRPKGLREISLAGIVYVSGEEWTVWLNGQRVTPKAIPKEVKKIKVHESYVEIQWFDAYTNQIFPIRLRSHQRFNLDNKMFLPG